MENHSNTTTFEDVLSLVGEFGKWQILLLITAMPLAGMFMFNNNAYVYIAYYQDHWCSVPELRNSNWTMDEIKNITVPKSSSNNVSYEKCIMYDRNYTHLSLLSYTEALNLSSELNLTTVKCNNWDYDTSVFTSTVVSEFNLVCDNAAYRPAIQTSYYIGLMISTVVFGPISDKFGRRTGAIFATYILILSYFGMTFAPTFYLFLVSRIIQGISTMGAYLCMSILVQERVGIKYRSTSMMILDFGVPASYAIGALITCLIRDWRHIYLIISAITIPFAAIPWIIEESPRWLTVKGRIQEAAEILVHAAKKNKRKISKEELLDVLQTTYGNQIRITEQNSVRSTLRKSVALWRTPEMRCRSFKIFCTWFIISQTFFGTILLSARLQINISLIMLLHGVRRFVLQLLCIWLLNRLPRKVIFSGFFTLIAAGLCVLYFVPKDQPWISFFVISIVQFGMVNFSIVYIYTGELFPTEYRSIAISVGSLHARLGIISITYIVDYLKFQHESVPVIFLCACALIATFVSLLLPETKHQPLPDTVNDVEQYRIRKQMKKRNESGSPQQRELVVLKTETQPNIEA